MPPLWPTDFAKNCKKVVTISVLIVFQGIGPENVRNDQMKQFFMKKCA